MNLLLGNAREEAARLAEPAPLGWWALGQKTGPWAKSTRKRRSAFYRHFEQANLAGAPLNWQSSSSVFVGQAGDKSRAVQHLARDAGGNPNCRYPLLHLATHAASRSYYLSSPPNRSWHRTLPRRGDSSGVGRGNSSLLPLP